jgi:hypothetical protein
VPFEQGLCVPEFRQNLIVRHACCSLDQGAGIGPAGHARNRLRNQGYAALEASPCPAYKAANFGPRRAAGPAFEQPMRSG